MTKRYNKWEKFYNQLSMVFHGIIALSMIPFAWAYLETQRQFPDPPIVQGASLMTIKVVGTALIVVIMFLSYRYSKNLSNEPKSATSIDLKLRNYLSAMKKDYLLLELACLLAFAGLYLTKDHLFTILYIAVLIMFSTKRPTYNRITKTLELSDEEVSEWINDTNKRDDQ